MKTRLFSQNDEVTRTAFCRVSASEMVEDTIAVGIFLYANVDEGNATN